MKLGSGPRAFDPDPLPPEPPLSRSRSFPTARPGGIARSGILLSLRILSKPSLALRLFSSLHEVSPNSILSLKAPAKLEAKGSVSHFEGDATERGLRQPRLSPLRCAAPGRGAPAWSGTGAGQAAKGPPPPPPAPLALLKVPGDPASLWDGVREIALSGGKKIIFTETKSACRGGGSDSEKVASILSAVGNSATTCVYCCNPARQISAFVCNSRDNAVLLGHCFEPG